MTRYLIEETASSQAVAALIKNPHDRTEVVSRTFESVGGKLESYYIAYTENKVYVLAELPDHDSLTTLLMTFMAGGGPTSVKATPLLTATEAVDIFKRAGSLDYSPPTQ